MGVVPPCRRLYPTGRYVLWILLEVAIICSSIQEVTALHTADRDKQMLLKDMQL